MQQMNRITPSSTLHTSHFKTLIILHKSHRCSVAAQFTAATISTGYRDSRVSVSKVQILNCVGVQCKSAYVAHTCPHNTEYQVGYLWDIRHIEQNQIFFVLKSRCRRN